MFTICSKMSAYKGAMWDAVEMMQRIIALLFALADLAERAATGPRHTRAHMLAILRIAEPVAQSIAFVAGGSTRAASREDDSPAAALRLAARLRMLACLLLTLLIQPQHADRPFSRRPVGAPGTLRRLGQPACLCHDTS
jgi:hypothetical protein